MQGRHLLLAAALLACDGGRPTLLTSSHEAVPVAVRAFEQAASAEATDGVDVPYDQAVTKSVHNAYARREPLLDQLVYHRVRSLELDVHARRAGASAPSGDWFVYHEDNPLMRGSSCARLSDCLGQLAAFHAAVPRHEVVTLFVDLKDPPSPGHGPADLDDAIARALGRENVVAPADLVASCPNAESVRGAVTGACRFPTLDALRGKFLVAVTGGAACDARSPVARYAGTSARSRLAFVAPNVDASCTMDDYDARPDVVFFNLSSSEQARADDVRRRGLVARVYAGGITGGLDDARAFARARQSGATHLVTDRVNFEEDAWTATHGASGFPFTCDGCGGALAEPGAALAVRASSGDQGGSNDDAYYALEHDTSDGALAALVSVPSSHVEPRAKACLVARASLDPSAANVAVCRALGKSGPRMQIRRTHGGPTTSIAAPTFDGVAADVPAFLRLAVERPAHDQAALDRAALDGAAHDRAAHGAAHDRAAHDGATVVASVSRDGELWMTVGRVTLDEALPYRGLGVSSHGDAPVKALFVDLVREREDRAASITALDLEGHAIGARTTGEVFDGIFADAHLASTPRS